MIGVRDATGAFAAAVAELPRTVQPADDAAGSIVVVASAVDIDPAFTAGARGVVLTQADAAAPSRDRPVVVLRPRLRDLPAAAASAVVAECSAPPAELEAVLADTVGWVRVLTGHAPRLVSSTPGMALLDSAGVPVTVLARPLSGAPDGGTIRVTALGIERREVEVDEPAGVFRVTVARDGETAVLAPRYESTERVVLRRMVAALDTGETPTDLVDLVEDRRLARAILAASA